MSKMTIATDRQGNVLGAIHHVEERKDNGGMQVGVSFGPGAQLHMVDVVPEIDMSKATDASQFHQALRNHLAAK